MLQHPVGARYSCHLSLSVPPCNVVCMLCLATCTIVRCKLFTISTSHHHCRLKACEALGLQAVRCYELPVVQCCGLSCPCEYSTHATVSHLAGASVCMPASLLYICQLCLAAAHPSLVELATTQLSGGMHWQAAEAWNKASKEEKAPHVLAAEREKVQYERLCDEYAMRKEAATAAHQAGVADMARHLWGAEVRPPHPPISKRMQHKTFPTACELAYPAELSAPYWRQHKRHRLIV